LRPKDLAIASIFSALCIVVGYGRGLAIPIVPDVEFMSVIIFATGFMFGIAGGILGRRYSSINVNTKFIIVMAIVGFALTFIYDVLSSIGFYVAYPGIYASIWEAIYLTFIPLWLPYPPIIHTITNTIVFAIVGPPIIKAIGVLPISQTKKHSS